MSTVATDRDYLMEKRRLLLAEVAAIEQLLKINPSTADLRHKGQEYFTLLSKGSLYDPDHPE